MPALNKSIQEKYANLPLQEARSLLDKGHLDTRKIISSHSDEELFEKKRYKWTGTTSMGSYFVSATSSHYDWAIKLIKKCLK